MRQPSEIKYKDGTFADALQAHKDWRNDDGGERLLTPWGFDLSGADLRGAVLSGAVLSGADLHGADLRGANLRGAIADYLTTGYHLACPESGAFDGWKKCRNGVISQLRIPARAKRSSATTRKCRAEYVKVLQVIDADHGVSSHDGTTVYRVGETVRCHEWDEDRWNECSGGIHFFLTRAEAEAWQQ